MEANLFHNLQPNNYSEAEILALFKDGKLFIECEESKIPVSSAAILAYIDPLEQFSSVFYKGNLSAMWKGIIEAKEFGLQFFALVKGPHKGELSPYRIISIVMFMKENEVFGITPTLQLVRALENSSPKTARSLYANIHNRFYPLNWEQITILNKILNHFKNV